MKKFNLVLVILILILTIFSISFATETEDDTMYIYTNESGELIQTDELDYENIENIDDMSEYESIYEDSAYESGQEEIKQHFDEQKKEFLTKSENNAENENQKMVITQVLSDIKTDYTTDYYSYYYAIDYQLVKIRTENKSEIPAVVILSYDLVENKNIPSLNVGDIVYGYVEYVNSTDEQYHMINHDFTNETIAFVSIAEQDRSLGIILLTVLTILLLVLYAGKNGAKLLIPLFVAIDLLFVVFAPEIELSKNILMMSILIAVELIILITVLKNGISRKTFVAITSSIIVVFLVAMLAGLFTSTNRLSGKNLMYYDIQSNVYYADGMLKSEIDTPMLYIAGIIIIASVITATIASKLTELSEKYAGSNDMTNNIIEEAKSIIGEYPMIISIIFLVMILPKYLMLILNGSTIIELLNSETLITEISMLLISLISVTIISPIHAIISNLLMGDVEIKQIEEKKD